MYDFGNLTYLVIVLTFGSGYRHMCTTCQNKDYYNLIVCGFMFRNLTQMFIPLLPIPVITKLGINASLYSYYYLVQSKRF